MELKIKGDNIRMELNKIKELIKIIEDTDISEINIEDEAEDISITIKQGHRAPVKQVKQGNGFNNRIKNPAKESDQKIKESESVQKDYRGEEITAPMVGTFYRSPAPEADSFIDVGDKISIGDTLCIIEAMKLMNEIEAEENGKIVEILVKDGEPVEYGQPMFIIEAD
jgi:acetyl-CoA carboxylase biotin carboxyl carrier protein